MTEETKASPPRTSKPMANAPLLGCSTGGCLLPFVFLIIAAALGDTGGPLFWPFMAILGAAIGTLIGFGIRANQKGPPQDHN